MDALKIHRIEILEHINDEDHAQISELSQSPLGGGCRLSTYLIVWAAQ